MRVHLPSLLVALATSTLGAAACGDAPLPGEHALDADAGLVLPDAQGAGDVLADARPADGATLNDTTTTPDTQRDDTSAAALDTLDPQDGALADVDADVEPADTSPADTEQPEDTTPTCADSPLPFSPSGPTSAWRHPISTPLARAAGDANHRGQDVVVKVGEPQRLVIKFAYGFIDADLKDEDVEIWTQREVPCGPWELLGVANTTKDGELGTRWGIDDDGGRVFFEIPEGDRLPLGRFPIRAVVQGDHSLASFDLVVVEAGTGAVVFDIDATLTTGDGQLMTEIAAEIFNGTYDQALREGALEIVQIWYDKGYLIVYLTGRPDYLRPMTERWVREHGFPPGILHLTDTNGQALPTNGGVGAYKRDLLQHLMGASVSLDLYAAYGNASTDIWAFAEAGLPKERTFIIGSHGGEEGTVALSSYPEHLPTAQAMPAATVPAPPASGWW